MRRVMLAIVMAIGVSSNALPADSAIGVRVADAYAIPAAADFARATAGLESEMADICASSEPDRDRARPAFAETLAAWARLSVLRFGPLTAENRFERILFWPDPRGAVLRQVQALLADQATPPPTAADLATRSVALQGLGAFEVAVFGDPPGPIGPHRCRYAQAVAGNVAALAVRVDTEWRHAFRATFTGHGAGNSLYRTDDEVVGEVLKALTTGLQSIRDGQLLPALGATPGDARGRRAPFWRSGLGRHYVEAEIRALLSLYTTAGLRDRLGQDAGWIDDALAFELGHAADAVAAVETPMQDAFARDPDRARLAYAAVALRNANRVVVEDLTTALGLVMGFNALDGD